MNQLQFADDPVENYENNSMESLLNYNKLYKFVTFNKFSGIIKSISTKKEFSSDDIICKKFKSNSVFKILSGTDSEKNYKIVFDIRKNKYIIVNNKYNVFQIDKKIFKFNLKYNKIADINKIEYDFLIIYFLESKIIRFILNPILKSGILRENKTLDLLFYLTDKRDPNLLFDVIKFTNLDLIHNHYLDYDISDITNTVSPLNLTLLTYKFVPNYQAHIVDKIEYFEIQESKTFNIQSINNYKDLNNILFSYNPISKLLTVKILDEIDLDYITNKNVDFYIVDQSIDGLIEKFTLDLSKLYQKQVQIIKLNNIIDLGKNKILFKENNLRIKYESTNY